MKGNTWMLAAGIIIAAGASTAWAKQQSSVEDIISGSSLQLDEEKGTVTVTNASINRPGLSIKSHSSQYLIDADGSSKTIELNGGVEIENGAAVFKTDAATYYPELETITAKELKLSSKGRITPAETINFTCSNGTLFGNGSPIAGGRYSNCAGAASALKEQLAAGGYTITCGGSGGNQVIMRRGCFD
ncbi:hypothetical protein E5C33_08470 [Stenotrophomonas maltophilia]|uniref:hypothetical protein n=1 Tax=Stenotrophomonas maltophilia TaxID=40324 RepID=UPI001075E550|nr:hypothetical protein [Stenotrophomonas maltophilia]TFZ45921.1 hypothetical protein E5C33_08470 [Stenotrophomonas maltophilia]